MAYTTIIIILNFHVADVRMRWVSYFIVLSGVSMLAYVALLVSKSMAVKSFLAKIACRLWRIYCVVGLRKAFRGCQSFEICTTLHWKSSVAFFAHPFALKFGGKFSLIFLRISRQSNNRPALGGLKLVAFSRVIITM